MNRLFTFLAAALILLKIIPNTKNNNNEGTPIFEEILFAIMHIIIIIADASNAISIFKNLSD